MCSSGTSSLRFPHFHQPISETYPPLPLLPPFSSPSPVFSLLFSFLLLLLRRGSEMAPRWPQEAPRGLKMTPRRPKMAPRSFKVAPICSKTPLHDPKRLQYGPKVAQDDPNTAPGWPQGGPKSRFYGTLSGPKQHYNLAPSLPNTDPLTIRDRPPAGPGG